MRFLIVFTNNVYNIWCIIGEHKEIIGSAESFEQAHQMILDIEQSL